MNQRRPKETLELYGWEKTPSGWVKNFEPLFEGKSNQNLPKRLRSKTPKKISKEDLDLKMTKASLKRQKILEDKKETARKLRSQSLKQSFQVLSDLSNQVDKVFISALPKPCVQEQTLNKLVNVQKLIQETTQMMVLLKKQENELIEQLANQANESQQMTAEDFELIWFIYWL